MNDLLLKKPAFNQCPTQNHQQKKREAKLKVIEKKVEHSSTRMGREPQSLKVDP